MLTRARSRLARLMMPTFDALGREPIGTWPEARRREAQTNIEELEKGLERVAHQIPQLDKQRRNDTRRLNRETAQFAVGQSIEEMKTRFSDVAKIPEHLEKVSADLIDNVAVVIMKGDDEGVRPATADFLDRYEVNVLVTQADHGAGAPIVEELHPTLNNLIGRIEYVSQQGVLVTNFRLIKPGSMRRANGGYLLLDARSLLAEPFTWSGLKRTLRQDEIRIEDLGRFLGLTTTVSLEPDPIPLDVKIVLFGDRLLHFLLAAFDPELAEHFKVLADFEDDIDRSPESEAVMARLVASTLRRNDLRPMDREAVGRMIEHAARLADHGAKLTLLVEQIRDVLVEADDWAAQGRREITTRADVERALEERTRRASRVRNRAQEMILQDVALIDTAAAHVGQVNGLSVRARRLSLRASGPYHLPGPAGYREGGRYRARGRARRADPLQGSADLVGFHCRPLCARRADVAVRQLGVRAVLCGRRRRQRVVG